MWEHHVAWETLPGLQKVHFNPDEEISLWTGRNSLEKAAFVELDKIKDGAAVTTKTL